MGQLVHKTLAINRVLIGVHAAPETGPDRGVAHRMVDQHVRNVIAERSLCPTRVETLKHCRIHPIFQICGRTVRACSRLNSSTVAAPGCGCFSDRASDELRNREGSRAALPGRHSGLARSVDPDLLLPRPAAIRSHKERSIRLPGGGKECKDAGCARFAVNGCASIVWSALSSGPPQGAPILRNI